MALIDTVATSRVTVPAFLVGAPNGDLPADWLRSWDEDGKMFVPVSFAFQALYLDAADHGLLLRPDSTGRYRTLARQVAMFDGTSPPRRTRYEGRYVPEHLWTYRAGGYVASDTGERLTSDVRTWKGRRWRRRSGTAGSAVPETSNHGLGLADDVASDADGDNTPEPMSDALLTFLRDVAPKHSIRLETRSERWHWHWVGGNALTQHTVDVLARHGVKVPDLSRFRFSVPGVKPTVPTAPPPIPTVPTAPKTKEIIVDAKVQTLRPNANAQRGYDVFVLQSVLNGIFAAGLKLDGIYGLKTIAAVQDAQRKLGITVDGICGPQTWGRLLNG